MMIKSLCRLTASLVSTEYLPSLSDETLTLELPTAPGRPRLHDSMARHMATPDAAATARASMASSHQSRATMPAPVEPDGEGVFTPRMAEQLRHYCSGGITHRLSLSTA